MKIGPLDIGIKTLAFGAGLVVVAMLDLRLVLSSNVTRAEGYYSTRLPQYLMAGIQRDYEEGLRQSDTLLTVLRGNVPARLYRATFLHRLGQFDKAREAFRAIADDASVSSQHRALAAYGVGTALFRERPADGKATAATEACEWYLKALKLDHEFADAKVGVLGAALWRLATVEGKEDTPDGQAVLKQVVEWLAAVLKQEAEPATSDSVTALLMRVVEAVEKEPRPPNYEGMALFYNLKGLVLGRAGKVMECANAFESAQSIRIKWEPAALNQWRTMLKLLPEAKLKLSDRENLLNEYQKKIPRFPKDAAVAYNALAMGWYRTKELVKPQDFAARGLNRALTLLKSGYDAGDPIAMTNAVALMDERLFGPEGQLQALSADLLLPFPPQTSVNPWKGGGEAKKEAVSAEARKQYKTVYETIDAMRKLLAECGRKVRLDARREVDLKLKMLACDMVGVAISEGGDLAARKAALAVRATELKAQASDNPEVLIAYAYFMLLSGDFREAGIALRRSHELKPDNEDVKPLIDVVSAKPALIQPRPTAMGWFGNRALLRVTLLSPESPGGMVSGEMSFDNDKVDAQVVGSQLVHLLPEGRLTGGKHVVKASAVDAYGNKAEIEYGFGVDKVPPKCSIEPSPGSEVAGPTPVWTVKLSDDDMGVDLASIQIRLNNVGVGATPIRAILVENGTYQENIPAAQVNRGDKVAGETFKIGSMRELLPGQYELTISFADQAGNKKTQSWTYQVK